MIDLELTTFSIATFADDTAILTTESNILKTFQELQITNVKDAEMKDKTQ